MPVSVYVDTNKRKSGTAGATQRWASLKKEEEEEEVTVMKMFLCVFTHCVFCKVKTKRASHRFNKCFIRHGMWKIPGKIRFIWPSESRVQETGSVKVSMMVFTQLVFISVPHCNNIWSRNPPSILLPIHTFSDIGGVGNHLHEETVPAIDTFCSGLPLFSYYSLSACQDSYSEQWEPITMVMNEMDIRWGFFFLLYFTHTHAHTRTFVPVYTCWWVLIAWFSWDPSVLLIPIHIQRSNTAGSLGF